MMLVSLKDIKGNKNRETTKLFTVEEDVENTKLIINNREYDLDTLEEKSSVEDLKKYIRNNANFIKNVIEDVYNKSTLWQIKI